MPAMAFTRTGLPSPAAAVGAGLAPASRRRLGGPGLRTFLAIAGQWELTEGQRLLLLGSPARPTYHVWARAARSGGDPALSVDTLTRVSAVLGIHAALQALFTEGQDRAAWLRGPHDAAAFNGQAPLDLATGGTMDGLLSVRRFLDAACTGSCMEPNEVDRGFTPYTASDLVWT